MTWIEYTAAILLNLEGALTYQDLDNMRIPIIFEYQQAFNKLIERRNRDMKK